MDHNILTWNPHVQYQQNKLSSKIFLLRKLPGNVRADEIFGLHIEAFYSELNYRAYCKHQFLQYRQSPYYNFCCKIKLMRGTIDLTKTTLVTSPEIAVVCFQITIDQLGGGMVVVSIGPNITMISQSVKCYYCNCCIVVCVLFVSSISESYILKLQGFQIYVLYYQGFN